MSTLKATPEKGGLGRAATSGVTWLIAQSLSARFFGFFSQLFLAALLLPADFGVIGLANTVTSVAQVLVGFGVDDVLLQRQRAMRFWSASAFWISFALGTTGMIAMIIAAPFAARAYHSSSLVGLIIILAVAMPIRTLATVPQVAIRLAMDFRFLAAYNTFEIAALQISTILLAWAGFGAYSFAIPVPVLAVIRAVLFWRKAPPKILQRFRLAQVRYMFGSSTIVFTTRIIVEFINQGDYMVLGIMATHNVVGLYYFAFRFSVQPVRMLAGNFSNVLFPALAQLRSTPEQQADAALRASRLLSYLVVPFCFLQAALAGPGLQFLFGHRWLGAIPLVQLLSIGLPFDAVSWITGSLMSARREFRRSLFFAAVSAPLFFGGVVLGAKLDGAIGVAAAVVVYYAVYPPICSILILRRGRIAIGKILELYVVPPLLSGASMGAGYGLSLLEPVSHSNFLRCVVIGIVGSAVYVGCLYVFRPDVYRDLYHRFSGMFRRVGWRSRPRPA
ncbi:MAG: oligosaccharide flippase family protein [Proteobacteria bacterium]|nr:oligosaccharide flippase family protein [Pseudomonadota bacterium]